MKRKKQIEDECTLITDKYLEDTIKDAKKKVGSQHSINKENLINICAELLEHRNNET